MGKQQERVLQYMKERGSITSMEAFQHLWVTRLSAVIFELKKKGYNIRSRMESHKNYYGETKQFARYSMVKQDGTV